jgi:hypothetical protein
MDSKGNIARFQSDELARMLGYDTPLSEAETQELQQVPKDERHSELEKLRAQRDEALNKFERLRKKLRNRGKNRAERIARRIQRKAA